MVTRTHIVQVFAEISKRFLRSSVKSNLYLKYRTYFQQWSLTSLNSTKLYQLARHSVVSATVSSVGFRSQLKNVQLITLTYAISHKYYLPSKIKLVTDAKRRKLTAMTKLKILRPAVAAVRAAQLVVSILAKEDIVDRLKKNLLRFSAGDRTATTLITIIILVPSVAVTSDKNRGNKKTSELIIAYLVLKTQVAVLKSQCATITLLVPWVAAAPVLRITMSEHQHLLSMIQAVLILLQLALFQARHHPLI